MSMHLVDVSSNFISAYLMSICYRDIATKRGGCRKRLLTRWLKIETGISTCTHITEIEVAQMRSVRQEWSRVFKSVGSTKDPLSQFKGKRAGSGACPCRRALSRVGEGTVDRDTVASNRSIENCLSNFNKRTSSKSSN